MQNNSEMPLERIAEKCGFFTTSYYTIRFKNIVGMSPGKYRKMLTKDN